MLDNLLIKRFLIYLRLEQSLSDNSIVAYTHDIELFMQYLKSINHSMLLKDIDQENIENFLAHLYELGLSANSQARILSGIKKFYAYLIQEKIIEIIKPIGLSQNKSKSILGLSRKLVEDFNGKVPETREELMSLPGVGRKTANVVLNVAFGQPTMPVDTHLLRICPKIGLAEGTTPEQVEKSLCERIPPEYMEHAHHWLILHGRYVCKAKNPECENCLISDICKICNTSK